MNLLDYLEKQKSAIVDEFVNAMLTCLVATTHDRIHKHAKQYGWELSSLPGTDAKSVIVLKKSENAISELWVRWNYRNYRRAFQIFLRHVHNCGDTPIPPNLQVDHLQATHRFKANHPDYFIRLFLMEQKINGAYGAGFEKSFNHMERENFPRGGIHMDWMMFLKVFGAVPPGKGATPEIWRTWARTQADILKAEGIDNLGASYDGILSVLQLGYTGYYAGSKDGGAYEFKFDEPTNSYQCPVRTTGQQYLYEFNVVGGITGVVTYKAEAEEKKYLLPTRRDLYSDYPGEFSWGYSGSGPTFLATSILAHHFGHDDFGSVEIRGLLKNFISQLPYHPDAGPFFITTEFMENILKN